MVRDAKKNKQHNPDKAKFMVDENGTACMGYITCGHEPRIWATIVKDVTVQDAGDGTQRVSWTDIPMPPKIPSN